MKKIFLGLLALSITLLPTTTIASTCKVPPIKGKDYAEARKILINNHWKPVKTIILDEDGDSPNLSGNGRIYWPKGFYEVENCSGSGLAVCTFIFKDKNNNKLRVVTDGEEFPEENIQASVHSYKCNPKNK